MSLTSTSLTYDNSVVTSRYRKLITREIFTRAPRFGIHHYPGTWAGQGLSLLYRWLATLEVLPCGAN